MTRHSNKPASVYATEASNSSRHPELEARPRDVVAPAQLTITKRAQRTGEAPARPGVATTAAERRTRRQAARTFGRKSLACAMAVVLAVGLCPLPAFGDDGQISGVTFNGATIQGYATSVSQTTTVGEDGTVTTTTETTEATIVSDDAGESEAAASDASGVDSASGSDSSSSSANDESMRQLYSQLSYNRLTRDKSSIDNLDGYETSSDSNLSLSTGVEAEKKANARITYSAADEGVTGEAPAATAANDGTFTAADPAADAAAASVAAAPATLAREGYTFAGWVAPYDAATEAAKDADKKGATDAANKNTADLAVPAGAAVNQWDWTALIADNKVIGYVDAAGTRRPLTAAQAIMLAQAGASAARATNASAANVTATLDGATYYAATGNVKATGEAEAAEAEAAAGSATVTLPDGDGITQTLTLSTRAGASADELAAATEEQRDLSARQDKNLNLALSASWVSNDTLQAATAAAEQAAAAAAAKAETDEARAAAQAAASERAQAAREAVGTEAPNPTEATEASETPAPETATETATDNNATARAAAYTAAANRVQQAFEALDADIVITDDVNALDFRTMRILVGLTSGTALEPRDYPNVVSANTQNNLYLLQYRTEDAAKKAYIRYSGSDTTQFVAPDTSLSAADDNGFAGIEGATPTDNATDLKTITTEGAKLAIEAASDTSDSELIALIDSGAPAHAQVLSRATVLDDGALDDAAGHGTNMMNTILEENPHARLISIRALNANGKGTAAGVYAAIQQAITAGATIINLSLSGPATESNAAIAEAVADARAAGIEVIAAAGNNAADASFFTPGNVSQAFTVAAADEAKVQALREAGTPAEEITSADIRQDSSNYGQAVDAYIIASTTSYAAARTSAWLSANKTDNWQDALKASALAIGVAPEAAPNPADAPAVETDQITAQAIYAYVFYDLSERHMTFFHSATEYLQGFERTELNARIFGSGVYIPEIGKYTASGDGILGLYNEEKTDQIADWFPHSWRTATRAEYRPSILPTFNEGFYKFGGASQNLPNDVPAFFIQCLRAMQTASFHDSFHPYSMAGYFAGCRNLKYIDFKNCNLDDVQDARGMFYDCQSMVQLELPVKRVSETSLMFFGCSALSSDSIHAILRTCKDSLRVPSGMFAGCRALQTLDLSNLNFPNCATLDWTFAGCTNIKTANLRNTNFACAVNASWMFYYCTALESIDLINTNFSSNLFWNELFWLDGKLKSIDLSKAILSKSPVALIDFFATDCTSLEWVNLGELHLASSAILRTHPTYAPPQDIGYETVFTGCSKLRYFTFMRSDYSLPHIQFPRDGYWIAPNNNIYRNTDESLRNFRTTNTPGTFRYVTLENATISTIPAQQWQFGQEIKPSVSVTLEGGRVINNLSSVAINATYTNCKEVGTNAQVTLQDAAGVRKSRTFSITKRPLSQSWVSIASTVPGQEQQVYYTGNDITPVQLRASVGNTLYDILKDYGDEIQLTYYRVPSSGSAILMPDTERPRAADAYRVAIAAKNTSTHFTNPTPQLSANFTIIARPANSITVTNQESLIYTGKSLNDVIKRSIQVDLGVGTVPPTADDFDATYYVRGTSIQVFNVVNAGDYEVALTSTKTSIVIPDDLRGAFVVRPATLTLGNETTRASVAVEGITPTVSYCGSEITQDAMQVSFLTDYNTENPPVAQTRTQLEYGKDYQVSYNNNLHAGDATLTIQGIGNFTGRVTQSFTIQVASLTSATITAIPDQAWTGSGIEPHVQVMIGGHEVSPRAYSLRWSNNINISTETSPAQVTVYPSSTSDFTDSVTQTFRIVPVSLAGAVIKASDVAWPASGVSGTTTVEPPVVVVANEKPVPVRTDANQGGYTLVYEAVYGSQSVLVNGKPAAPGPYKVRAIGSGTYTDSTDGVLFEVKADKSYQDITSDSFVCSLNPTSAVYTGKEIRPEVTVMPPNGVSALIKEADYTVEYYNNVNVGTATVIVSGTGAYNGFKVMSDFEITPFTLTANKVSSIPRQAYTGAPIEPPLVVRGADSQSVLREGVDYTVSFSNNTGSVGGTTEAQVRVSGMGNYAGNTTRPFTIVDNSSNTYLDLSQAVISLNPNSYTYNGLECRPKVTVRINGEEIPQSDNEVQPTTYYSITYADNTEAGTARVVISANEDAVWEGKGLIGSKQQTFTISPIVVQQNEISAEVLGSYAYTGFALSPQLKVTYTSGGVKRELVAGSDYSVRYNDTVRNAGSYTGTVTLLGNYALASGAAVSVDVQVSKASLSLASIDAIADVLYDGAVHAPVPVVRYAGLEVPANNYTVSYSRGSGNATVPETNPRNAGTYTLTVQASTNSTNFEGSYTTTFKIEPRDIAEATVMTATTPLPSGGETFKAQMNVLYGGTLLQLATQTGEAATGDYTLTYHPLGAGARVQGGVPVSPGEYTVVVSGINNYQGTQTTRLYVTVGSTQLITRVDIQDASGLIYTGKPQMPAVKVFAGEVEVPETNAVGAGSVRNYEVSYASNVNAGQASVIVQGMGNYAGLLTANFTIAPAQLSSANVGNIPPYVQTSEDDPQPIRPPVVVTFNDLTLSEGSDYTVEYGDNLRDNNGANNEGSVTIKAVAGGNFTTTPESGIFKNFDILPVSRGTSVIDLSRATVTLSQSSYAYNGTERRPTVSLSMVVAIPGDTSGRTMFLNLVEGKHYNVVYQNNVRPGTARVLVVATGQTYGTESEASTSPLATYLVVGHNSADFSISAQTIDNNTPASEISVTIDPSVYTGDPMTPSMTVVANKGTVDERVLVRGYDYSVSGVSNNVEPYEDERFALPNAPAVTIKFAGSYEGTITKNFIIEKASLQSVTIAPIAPQELGTNGKAEPELNVTYRNETLRKGVDYNVVFKDNDREGVATATLTALTGSKHFKGTTQTSFAIGKGSVIGETYVEFLGAEYTGAPLNPVHLRAQGTTQPAQDIDYTVSYAVAATNPGNAALSGNRPLNAGNYVATISLLQGSAFYPSDGSEVTTTYAFSVTPFNLRNARVSSSTSVIYNGTDRSAEMLRAVSVTVDLPSSSARVLTPGTDYRIVSARSVVNAGDYPIVIEGVGNFTGRPTARANFTISKAQATFQIVYAGSQPNMGPVGLTYGDAVPDYEVQIVGMSQRDKNAMSKNYTDSNRNAIRYLVNETANAGAAGTHTVTVLLASVPKNYTVTNRAGAVAAQSDVLAKVQYRIEPRDIADSTVTANVSEGMSNLLSDTKLRRALMPGSDYSILYYYNEGGRKSQLVGGGKAFPSDAGSYIAHLSGLGNFKGSRDVAFTLGAGGGTSPAVSLAGANVSFDNTAALSFTGSAQNVGVRVSGVASAAPAANGAPVAGTDYTVSYRRGLTGHMQAAELVDGVYQIPARDVGTYYVTVIAKPGSAYAGSATGQFVMRAGTLSAANATASIANVAYGANMEMRAKPVVKLTGTDVELTQGVDYTVSFGSFPATMPMAAGNTVLATFTGIGNWSGALGSATPLTCNFRVVAQTPLNGSAAAPAAAPMAAASPAPAPAPAVAQPAQTTPLALAPTSESAQGAYAPLALVVTEPAEDSATTSVVDAVAAATAAQVSKARSAGVAAASVQTATVRKVGAAVGAALEVLGAQGVASVANAPASVQAQPYSTARTVCTKVEELLAIS